MNELLGETEYPIPPVEFGNYRGGSAEYRGEIDVIGNFLKECCIYKPEVSMRIRELFKAYQDWCEGNNEHAVSERFFGLHLKEMEIEQSRTSEARFWSGLALRA